MAQVSPDKPAWKAHAAKGVPMFRYRFRIFLYLSVQSLWALAAIRLFSFEQNSSGDGHIGTASTLACKDDLYFLC